MNITELIEDGKRIAKESIKIGAYGMEYYSGENLENWLALAIRYVEANFPNDADTIRFRELAGNVMDNGESNFFPLIAILEAFKVIPPTPLEKDIMPILSNIFNNFNRFDINIKRRYADRVTIDIQDEYDVQDAVLSILKLFIDDVRPEDYVPSYAGANSRVDFLLPSHSIVVEIKMTNKSLSDKQIGEQLIIDFERYKQLPNYNHLICFVYDRNSNIKNPHGLIHDLEKLSDSSMRLTVFISPL